MKFSFKYDKRALTIDLSDEMIIQEIHPKEFKKSLHPLEDANYSLLNPIGSPSLYDLIKTHYKVLIIVNDITRLTPYKYMLPPLMNILKEKGIKNENITLLIATGTHRPNTEKEIVEMYGPEITASGINIVNHDCNDKKNLTYYGTTKMGNDIYLNNLIDSSDFIISTGVIGFHYFAGYSGGRKSILPGIAARESIQRNHAMMVDERAYTANIIDNPVNDELIEVPPMLKKPYFIFNVVTSPEKDIIAFVSGNYKKAWVKGIEIYDKIFKIPIKKLADVVIADAGGYSKDINMYQAQKALDNALMAVKKGGTIVLVASCKEGLGNKVFETWIREAEEPKDIIDRLKKEFVIGGHKAYAIVKAVQKADIILVSDFTPEIVSLLFFKYAANLEDAIKMVKEKYNKPFTITIFPNAGNMLPYMER